jgi:hypothetical protein
VVTAGEDGVIFVITISGSQTETDGGRRSDSRAVGNEIAMINRGEIQVRLEEFQILEAENSTLQARLEEEKSKLEGECRARVSAARQKDQEEIVDLRRTYETLQATATANERNNLKILKTMEATHMQAADVLGNTYDKKISAEADRFVAVEGVLKTLTKRIDVMREDSQAQLEQVRLGLQEDLRRQVSEKENEIQKLKDLLAFSKHRFDTMLDQEGMEYDFEIAELKRQSQEELEQQRMVEYKLKKEQDTLLRGLDKMEHDRDQISKQQFETKMTIKALTKETGELGSNVDGMKGERREREATLRERELQIGAYKMKVNTLNKFKHVLDFRLREVAQSLQPKDQMIEHLNEDLMKLEAEFEMQLARQHQMVSVLQQKDARIKELQEEGEQLRGVINARQRRIDRFHSDLYDLVQKEQDIRCWPEAMLDIYRDHVNLDSIAKDSENAVPMGELRSHTKLMERKVSQLGKNKASIEDRCKQDIQSKTAENSLLIHELNLLRVERKSLQRQVKDLDLRVRLRDMGSKSPKALEDNNQASISSQPQQALEGAASDPLLNAFFAGSLPLGGKGLPAERTRPLSGQRTAARTTWQHAGGERKQRPNSHMAPEVRGQMQQLLAKADLNQQQIEMQSLENKLLRDQLETLSQRKAGAAEVKAPESTYVAGAAHKAVRQASPFRKIR